MNNSLILKSNIKRNSNIKYSSLILALVVILDLFAITISFFIFYLVRVHSGIYSDLMGYPFWLISVTLFFLLSGWMFAFWFFGVYFSVHNRSLFDEFYSVTKVIAIVCTILLLLVYIETANVPNGYPSTLFISILIYFLLNTFFIGFSRWFVRHFLKLLRRKGIGLKKTIIVGESSRSLQLLDMFDNSLELGYKVMGTVLINGNESPIFSNRSLGNISDINSIIEVNNIEVTVLGMESDRALIYSLITESKVSKTTVKIIPDLYELINGQTKAQHLYGVPLIEISPEIMLTWQKHSKRILDIIFSIFALIITSPIMLLTIIFIKLEDGGPVFYSQNRVGLNNKEFKCHKFRSMRTDAEVKGISWTKMNDSRVTKVGKFIRSTHIDELPQFWNVVVGEMSVVGPRPERPFYVEKYSKLLPSYPRRLRVQPGLTGWNQVQADEIVENIEYVRERLRHDFFYIENISLRLDIEIMFRTLIRVLGRKGQA
ncbi:MAG: sugar transferase [Chlorobi bacterium]|nr:sugar transferase [Chlorobiota bacterium]